MQRGYIYIFGEEFRREIEPNRDKDRDKDGRSGEGK
jgi:hypothetical protein